MRASVGSRLLRLLAMAGYLAEHRHATFDELSERFGLPPRRIAHELELATMCEIPPFTGSPLFDLTIDDTGVTVYDIPEFLDRPPRLNRSEGFAVLAAGEAVLAAGTVDHGPLRSALAKLGDALGLDPDAIDIDIDRPPTANRLQQAVDERRRLAVTYYTASRDELTERRIDPIAVHHTDGRWYLEAFDHRSDGPRKFRIDRIETITDTEEHFDPIAAPDDLSSYTPGPDARPVTIALPAEAAWVAEAYPVTARRDHDDGTFEVTFDVVGTAWLERLLLRVGPAARVLDPADLADVGRQAARRLSGHYADGA